MEPNANTTVAIDEQLLRSVRRQLRAIKFMLGFFFVMMIAMLAILGFIAYKVITFTHDVTTKINNIETKTSQDLNLKSQVCDNKSLTSFLGSSNVCK